jgi:hypothetical protein
MNVCSQRNFICLPPVVYMSGMRLLIIEFGSSLYNYPEKTLLHAPGPLSNSYPRTFSPRVKFTEMRTYISVDDYHLLGDDAVWLL